MRRAIGIGLLVLLFGGLFGAGAATSGWQDTLLGWGMLIGFFSVLVLALWLTDTVPEQQAPMDYGMANAIAQSNAVDEAVKRGEFPVRVGNFVVKDADTLVLSRPAPPYAQDRPSGKGVPTCLGCGGACRELFLLQSGSHICWRCAHTAFSYLEGRRVPA